MAILSLTFLLAQCVTSNPKPELSNQHTVSMDTSAVQYRFPVFVDSLTMTQVNELLPVCDTLPGMFFFNSDSLLMSNYFDTTKARIGIKLMNEKLKVSLGIKDEYRCMDRDMDYLECNVRPVLARRSKGILILVFLVPGFGGDVVPTLWASVINAKNMHIGSLLVCNSSGDGGSFNDTRSWLINDRLYVEDISGYDRMANEVEPGEQIDSTVRYFISRRNYVLTDSQITVTKSTSVDSTAISPIYLDAKRRRQQFLLDSLGR